MNRTEATEALASLGYRGDHAAAILQDAWDWSVCRTVHRPFVSSLVVTVDASGAYDVQVTERGAYGLQAG